MSSSFTIFLLTGIIAGLALFFLAEYIAIELFHNPALILPLKIFSLALPLTKISGIIANFFLGFHMAKPLVLFNNIIKHFLLLIFVIFIVSFQLAFINVYYAYVVAMAISCLLIGIYAIKKISLHKRYLLKNIRKDTAKELILFSLPLLGTSIINVITKWVDTLMLGNLKDASYVGLYNSVAPLSDAIVFPLSSMAVIYMPIIASLYANKKQGEIKRNYTILTKWIFLIALPIFLIFVLFPDQIILFLFGNKYISASLTFQIVCIGAVVSSLFALNNHNLIALGKTKTIMIAFFLAAVVNITLNAILIPSHDIEGAAIATVIAIIIANSIMSSALYLASKVQPFSKNLIKSTFAFLPLFLGSYLILTEYITFNIIYIFLLYVFCYVLMLISLIITRSIDKEDLNMLENIERKTGIKLGFLKKLFKKAM
jgi:O-antigen/teichoic acid export membrane protein